MWKTTTRSSLLVYRRRGVGVGAKGVFNYPTFPLLHLGDSCKSGVFNLYFFYAGMEFTPPRTVALDPLQVLLIR